MTLAMSKGRIVISEMERAALEILRTTGVDVVEAALVAREALRVGRGRVRRALECIGAGEVELRRRERTVCFARAVEAALEARKDRRARTLSDFRYISRRLMKKCPGLAERRVRSISAADCAGYLQRAFDTPRQRVKAHAILSGIFRTAQRRGWCADNPLRNVEKPRVQEAPIAILTQVEITRLLDAARVYAGGACLPAVGLMLYAGLRPHEVARLCWEDINLTHSSIRIQPRHSKTGGARRVTIHPPLARLLSSMAAASSGRICPRGWVRHWRELHRAAGFTHWQPDVLRHTFANHHLAHFRSYAALQLEMGHRSAELLRSRYITMPEEEALFIDN